MVYIRSYLKYQITQEDIDRGRATGGVGITTTTAKTTINGNLLL